MGLLNLLLLFGVAAIILTLLTVYVLKIHKSVVITFLQHYCGVWFFISGFVKAVDPLGTAYKMHQYFAEFESTCQGSFLHWLAPVFPILNDYAISFGVFMIVLEMILGLFLIFGWYKKFTSWTFAAVVVFFTILTGFTYLTGYVPEGVNFFTFSKWDVYNSAHMKVTDCGCFGDFLKLEPKVSFTKDLFLLIPAFIFIIKRKLMHTWLMQPVIGIVTSIATVGFIFYCLDNFYFDIPSIDFRPFKAGVNVRDQKAAEEKASADVQVIGFKLQNLKTKKIVEISSNAYNTEKDKYPSDSWETIDQIKTEPKVKRTKISDYSINDSNGEDITQSLLDNKGSSLMISAYELSFDKMNTSETMLPDTMFLRDTILLIDPKTKRETISIVERIDKISSKSVSVRSFVWNENYISLFKTKIVPLLIEAKSKGINCYMVCNSYPEAITDFRKVTGFSFPIYTADDLVIKTFIRSNPGLTIWNNGKIVQHYHHRHLPSISEIEIKIKADNK